MIRWNFKKALTSLMTVMGIGTLTSCYGMPIYCGNAALYGYVASSEDYQKDCIEGIKVTVFYEDKEIGTALTDKDGYYSIELDGNYYNFYDENFRVKFSDVDGDKNGSFKEKTIEISFDMDMQQDMVLEKE